MAQLGVALQLAAAVADVELKSPQDWMKDDKRCLERNERDPAERCREKLSEFGGCTSEPHTVLRCLAERLSESGGCASERFGGLDESQQQALP